mgnify:CR=1 FL=1
MRIPVAATMPNITKPAPPNTTVGKGANTWGVVELTLSCCDRYVSDTNTNLTLGSNYLNMVLVDLDGSWVLASAAYNAGPGAVDKHGGIPPYEETNNYVAKILHSLNQF